MTVAVSVKVFDGIVLAADSATTFTLQDQTGKVVRDQVYNSANKIFHLHRDLPIGAMTWGLANIRSASIATLAKDLRQRLMGGDQSHADWALDPATYTISGVAERLVEMMFDELYQPEQAARAAVPGAGPAPVLGFLVAGYSAGESNAESWVVLLTDPAVRPTPTQVAAPQKSGWWAFAQPEAVYRLAKGHGYGLREQVLALIPDPQAKAAVEQVFASYERQIVLDPMPFEDAINLAKFLVDTTVGFVRYSFGPDTVGGPVEVAGISRHEGFKWIHRKHYYQQHLNPKDPHP